MRSIIVLISLFLIFSFTSSIVGYRIPGKIKLCKAASGMHSNFIDKYVTAGIILSHKKQSEQQYTFYVNKEKWNNELFESQEVVAIGGWCRVANKNGRGEVYIYDNKSKDVIGTVIDGNYEA